MARAQELYRAENPGVPETLSPGPEPAETRAKSFNYFGQLLLGVSREPGDPKGAQAAYGASLMFQGHKRGQCSCCSMELTGSLGKGLLELCVAVLMHRTRGLP